tara:strand:- start:5988 stop:6545 length:558 start_codon:yes stop_codon:yes gene_type:complete
MPLKKKNKKKETNNDIIENEKENNNTEARFFLCNDIQSNILNLSQNELYEIFKILYKNNSTYTKNNNGIFVNLNWLDYDILKQIYNYIHFCIKSHKEITKYEIMKNMYNENLNKKKYKNDSEENFENGIYQEKNSDNQIINTKIVKVSSSMKFYLFKKKFLKKYPIVSNVCNLLVSENYLIKNDL